MVIYLIQGLISKSRTKTKQNITKRTLFQEIRTLYFIPNSFRKNNYTFIKKNTFSPDQCLLCYIVVDMFVNPAAFFRYFNLKIS